ncbi:MAG: DNA sulfur modification protein DndE [Sideroxyarcus sp.]|nr:DNA sulfur modification protein DndE [Sideroxyarcus sp.]
MIERIKLTAAAKVHLSTLKRRTGIEHNNTLCRHALCISLANPSAPPEESFSFAGGIEIEWRTFTGGQDALYHNLLVVRLMSEGRRVTEELVRQTCLLHLHRGLSYLVSRREDDLLVEMAKSIAA